MRGNGTESGDGPGGGGDGAARAKGRDTGGGSFKVRLAPNQDSHGDLWKASSLLGVGQGERVAGLACVAQFESCGADAGVEGDGSVVGVLGIKVSIDPATERFKLMLAGAFRK